MGPDPEHRTRQLQIRHVVRIQLARRHGQARVDAVAPAVGPDGVALAGVADGADDRTPDEGVGVAPADWNGIDALFLQG